MTVDQEGPKSEPSNVKEEYDDKAEIEQPRQTAASSSSSNKKEVQRTSVDEPYRGEIYRDWMDIESKEPRAMEEVLRRLALVFHPNKLAKVLVKEAGSATGAIAKLMENINYQEKYSNRWYLSLEELDMSTSQRARRKRPRPPRRGRELRSERKENR